ncbi:hypothetical protein GZ77_00660 [Endozoicomonas montiporae]|uniref:Methyltransferase domain-containing protein n=2 Tax=Endozoicomonas montiporae TaxID=1027273 RepID=A0A081N9V9_9GAMM|nr:class I SAM-dependent methyltransferase [Endozoicomonas montiporae]AMO57105.1 type 11 methyltransferase [Endozoicomonas montiporae CL-33]KEQ15232.1 hypothetical protein GZ77_00660 [Endozoicomonas montiporae]
MSGDEVTSVFKDRWSAYQWLVENNLMGLREILVAARSFIQDRYKDSSVTLTDFGCGNSLLIPELTHSVQLDYYFGIDLAENALSMAQRLLESNRIKYRQFCQDLFLGMPQVSCSSDLIYSAFAVHHGDEQQKRQFFSNLYQQVSGECSFVLADIMIHEGQSFNDYTNIMEQYFVGQGVRSDWLPHIMTHIRQYDYPETEDSWLDIVRSSGWNVVCKQSVGPVEAFPAIFMILDR